MPNKKILFIVSGICYGLMAVFPGCWWMAGIWAIPLWWGAWHDIVPVSHALGWYLLAMGGHMIGIVVGLYRLSGGPLYMRFVVPILVFVYYGSLTILWLLGTAWVARVVRTRSKLKGDISCLGIWVIATWLYIIVICDYSLAICGSCGGYALCSPLIPFIEVPCLLWPLLWINERCFLFCVLLVQAIVLKELFIDRKAPYISSVIIALWIIGAYGKLCCVVKTTERDAAHIGVIQSQFFEENPQDALQHIVCHIKDFVEGYSLLSCIIFPESSVYNGRVFSAMKEVDHPVLTGYDGTCVIGGFRRDNEATYNTVWLVAQGYVVDYYDKYYVLPITEYTPWWGSYCGVKEQFFCKMSELTAAEKKERPVWRLTNEMHAIPYICSEFFLQKRPPQHHHNSAALLILCNTTWALNITRWIMMRTAAFRAVSWQRTVVYVAHGCSTIITTEGHMYSLKEETRICDNRGKK